MAEFSKNYSTFIEFNSSILAISADSTVQSSEFKREMAIPFTLLCDANREVITRYNLLNAEEHNGIAYPSIFVLDSDATIRYRSLDRTYNRVDLSEVLTFLKSLSVDSTLMTRSGPDKKFLIPKPGALIQMTRNMMFRASGDDWIHYLNFISRPIFKLFRSKKGPSR